MTHPLVVLLKATLTSSIITLAIIMPLSYYHLINDFGSFLLGMVIGGIIYIGFKDAFLKMAKVFKKK